MFTQDRKGGATHPTAIGRRDSCLACRVVYGVVAVVLAVALIVRLVGGHSGMRRGDVLIAVMSVAAGGKFLVLAGHLDVTVARVFTESATVVTFVVGMEMLRAWWAAGDTISPAWTWAWRVSTAVVLVSLATVTLINGNSLVGVAAKGEQPVFASAGVMSMRYVVLGVWVAVLAAVMLVLVARFASHASPGAVRQSLILVAVCEASFTAYGVLWLLQGVSDPTAVSPTPWADAALGASRIGAVFIAVAFLRLHFTRLPGMGRWSDQRALRLLAPLWHRLYALDPASSLLGALPDTTRGLSAADLQVTLWRVMVEIREWLDEVAVRLPEHAYTLACQASRATGASDSVTRAAAGQAWIAAGLAAGPVDVSAGTDRPPVGTDLDEELRELLLLVKPLPRSGRLAAAAAAAGLGESTDRSPVDFH